MKKASEVFNNIRFAKGESRGKQHSSTDNEEHYTVGEKEYEQQIKHVKKMAMQEDSLKSACWKGYTAVGMKMKNGRKVPNCVPVKEDAEELNEMPGANMDTRAVHSHLKKKGWKLSRTAGSHDVFTHPDAEHHIAVPRHKQLKAPLVKGILKQSEVKEEIEQVNEGEGIVRPRKTRASFLPPAPGTYAHALKSGEYAKYGFTKSGKETAEAKRKRMNKEEVEQLDEISQETKKSYVQKAKAEVKELKPHVKGEYGSFAKNIIARRKKGIQMAKEESEELVDTPAKKTLSKSAGMVKDLYKKAKSKKETPEKFQAEPELSSQITKV